MLSQSMTFEVKDLGLVDYQRAYDLQKSCVAEVINGAPQVLILCEHPAVLTVGRMGTEGNILVPHADLVKRDVPVVHVDRGGDITLHCPGQLIAYPIFNLNFYGRDLRRFIHMLEQVAIDLLGDFGIVASRFSGRTGVWVDGKKVCSLGIGVRKWVSFHGLGVNVNSDLNLFSLIRPCGLDVSMTSLCKIKNEAIDMGHVKEKLVYHFRDIFKVNEGV